MGSGEEDHQALYEALSHTEPCGCFTTLEKMPLIPSFHRSGHPDKGRTRSHSYQRQSWDSSSSLEPPKLAPALPVPTFPNVIPILPSTFQSILLHNCTEILIQQLAGVLCVSSSPTEPRAPERHSPAVMVPGDYKIHEPGIFVALFNSVVPFT